VYDNRNQERALVAMRLAQASRRKAVVAPPQVARSSGSSLQTPQQAVVVVPPQAPAAVQATPAAAAAAATSTAPPAPPVVAPTGGTPATAPVAHAVRGPRGPLRAEFLTSSEVAAGETTAALRARWTLVYGRKASSYNIDYLRRACVAPGLDVGPRRLRVKPSVAKIVAMEASGEGAAWVAAAAGDGETDGDGEALLSEDSAESGPSDQEYSVVDSEEVEGEEPRMPVEVDADVRVVTRPAALSDSSSEGEEEEGSTGADSEDARELVALAERQQRARRQRRKERKG